LIKNLKTLREKKGISQAALAEELGISQQAVNKYENKPTEPDIATLVKIANYFDTSIDFLVGNSEFDHKVEKVSEYQLNDIEINVMEDYRSLSHEQKDLVNNTMKIIKQK